MFRFLFSRQEDSSPAPAVRPPSPVAGTTTHRLKRIGKGTFTERLKNVEHDLDRIPRLLLDAVHATPMDNPYMVDFVRDHAIDEKTLEKNNNINPVTRQPVDRIPTDLQSLYDEIKKIHALPDYVKLKSLRESRVRHLLHRDAMTYCLEKNQDLKEPRKNRLANEMMEIEKQLADLNIQIPDAEKPLKAVLTRLSRLEGQVELLIQRDKFISLLEDIYVLQHRIDQALAQSLPEKTFNPNEDILSECYQMAISPLAAESQQFHHLINLASSLLAKTSEFCKLTNEIINSENKDEDAAEHARITAAKNEEKSYILEPFHDLTADWRLRLEQWQTREAQILQLIDRKQICIRQLQHVMRLEPDLKASFYKAEMDYEYILRHGALNEETIAERTGRRLLGIVNHALELIDNNEPDSAVLDAVKAELRAFHAELEPQLLAVSRQIAYFRMLENISRLEQLIESEVAASVAGLSKSLHDSDLQPEEIEHIMQDQRGDIHKSDPVVSKKFALATELEACLKLSEIIGITEHQQSLRDKLNAIYTDLQFLVPAGDEAKDKDKPSITSVLNLPRRLSPHMHGNLYISPYSFHGGLFHARALTRQRPQIRYIEHHPEEEISKQSGPGAK